MLDSGSGHQEGAGEVRAKHVVPRRGVEVAQRPLAADPRVADEGVEPAEPVDRRLHRARSVRGAAGVGDDGEPVDLARDPLHRPGTAARDRDRVAVRGEPSSDGSPDAGPAARDQGDLVALRHLPSSRTVSRSSTV